jgi:hypothetical protein
MRVLVVTSAYPEDRDDARGSSSRRIAGGLVREGIEVTAHAPGTPSAARRTLHDAVLVKRASYWVQSRQQLATGLGGLAPNLREHPGWLCRSLSWSARADPWGAATGIRRRARSRALDLPGRNRRWVRGQTSSPAAGCHQPRWRPQSGSTVAAAATGIRPSRSRSGGLLACERRSRRAVSVSGGRSGADRGYPLRRRADPRRGGRCAARRLSFAGADCLPGLPA